VLVVFPSEGFLFAGYLTAVWTGARLFPYFHNTYLENRRGLSRRFARWLQARVFARAAHVFVMSEGMVELYRARYPGLRCSALPHSFAVGRGDVVPPRDIGSPLRLIISGNINESCSEATVRVCEAIAQIGGASLTLLSPNPRSVLANLGLLRDGVTHEVASPDEVVARLQQADIVVLAHGFDGSLAAEEYRTIFPTRTIEYLICGRPILAHAPPDCYLTRFLLEHDCAVLVTERSVAALTDAIARLRTDAALRARLVRNAVAAAQMFEAPRVAGLLRDRLRAS
jgi:glycosyltransferase involved in cell wall biosynthesis